MGIKTKTYRVIGGPTDLDGRTQKLGAEHTFQVREDGSTIVSKDKKNWQEIPQIAPVVPAPVTQAPPAPVISEAEKLDVDQAIIKDLEGSAAATAPEVPFEVIPASDQNDNPFEVIPASDQNDNPFEVTTPDKKNPNSIL
jgi:hypothetical protein